MNSLNLRISGGTKTKNTFCVDIVVIPEKLHDLFDVKREQIRNFLEASTVDEQLTVLKRILDSSKGSPDEDLIQFLVVVFLQAEFKHPVKCFLTRCVTKSDSLPGPFSAALAAQLARLAAARGLGHGGAAAVAAAACLDNFPAGAAALGRAEIPMAECLRDALACLVKTLSQETLLSPTEKNEVFTMAHTTLRVVLHIVQKVSPDNVDKLILMYTDIRASLQMLLFDEEVPMDTKTLCGIVYVTMHISQSGPDSWISILDPSEEDASLQSLLRQDASRLCLLSALATAVAADRLQTRAVRGSPAVLLLTDDVFAVGDRTSSDATFNLAVARTLVQLAKGLESCATEAGERLAAALLPRVWAGLDHGADSVRHLAAMALASVVRHAADGQRAGRGAALAAVLRLARRGGGARRAGCAALRALAAALGAARALAALPGALAALLEAAATQPAATSTLEMLLEREGSVPPGELYERWAAPVLARAARAREPAELAALEALLTRVVKMDERVMDYILPHIKESNGQEDDKGYDLKCTLMLLSVGRKSGALRLDLASDGCRWRGVVPYEMLWEAAVSADEQCRILSLSLVVECPRATEPLAPRELRLVLHFLRHNINAQPPNYRQLVLALMKKLLKRLEDSHKGLRREAADGDCYRLFVEELRARCFGCLLPGANYGRRRVALQLLAWCEQIHLDGCRREWKEDYVEKLLQHLEDSYEGNKALALEVLQRCPAHLLRDRKYSVSLELEDIMQQASSVKPADSASAAFKLSLVKDRLPEKILQHQEEPAAAVAEAAGHALLRRLLAALRRERAACAASVAAAARCAPMHGLVRCMARVVDSLDPQAISKEEAWSDLVDAIISTCMAVSDSVASVVNSAAPEGLLPPAPGGRGSCGSSGDARLADGRPVTAQMVLLCAWRSVKEVSLLLGSMCSRLELSARRLLQLGAHFTALLAAARHRGAFEQAYLGFGALLARLWRSREPELHELPGKWLDELLEEIQHPSDHSTVCATRRSAGLPFMIQALLVAAGRGAGAGAGRGVRAAGAALLAARGAGRAAAAHVLRALVRAAPLREAVAPLVAAALARAVDGFDGTTWEERNSSTLLFSALMVRVFGVQRSRAERLCTRNRMTGRIFFQRYPELYELLLSKVRAVDGGAEPSLRPSLYPALLLLARLYPSSLEGTVSHLKLSSFVGPVRRCARSPVLRTRQLAARALVPLVAHDRYLPTLEEMFLLLADRSIERNHCHGVLLQITHLLDNRPEELAGPGPGWRPAARGARGALRRAAGRRPCYVIADQLCHVVNLLLWKFPTALDRDTVDDIRTVLHSLLFECKTKDLIITVGREVCLTHAAYLSFVILTIDNENPCSFVYKCLSHECYDVVLTALNYILILHKELEVDNRFEEHLSSVTKLDALDTLKETQFYTLLCDILKNNKYLECYHKALKVLTLSGSTQRLIIQSKEGSIEVADDVIVEKLIFYIENEHENLTHLYLKSLSHFVVRMLRERACRVGDASRAVRAVYACAAGYHSEATRTVVADFLDATLSILLTMDLSELDEEERFELHATVYSMAVTLLGDDEATLRQRTAGTVSRVLGAGGREQGAAALGGREQGAAALGGRAECALLAALRGARQGARVLVLLALLDFRSEVLADDGEDECRVFDHNERYNIHLEEVVWSKDCADVIKAMYRDRFEGRDLLEHVLAMSLQAPYRSVMDRLCGDHVARFRTLASGEGLGATDAKVELFVKELLG